MLANALCTVWAVAVSCGLLAVLVAIWRDADDWLERLSAVFWTVLALFVAAALGLGPFAVVAAVRENQAQVKTQLVQRDWECTDWRTRRSGKATVRVCYQWSRR